MRATVLRLGKGVEELFTINFKTHAKLTLMREDKLERWSVLGIGKWKMMREREERKGLVRGMVRMRV